MSNPNDRGDYPGWPVLAGAAPPPQRPSPSNRLILVVGAVIVATIIGAALLAVLTRSDGTAPAPVFGGTGNAAPVPGNLEGTWSGSISTPYGVFTTWPLKITVAADGSPGRFNAPSLRCSGTLTVVEVNPDSTLLELATQENPAQLCTRRSSLTLTPRRDGGVDVAYQDLVNTFNTGTGVLSR